MMAKTPDRAMLSRLVDAYDQIEEESLGLGDPELHEIEDQLYEAIVESRYRNRTRDPDARGHPEASSDCSKVRDLDKDAALVIG
jgi:hypothetical protein